MNRRRPACRASAAHGRAAGPMREPKPTPKADADPAALIGQPFVEAGAGQ